MEILSDVVQNTAFSPAAFEEERQKLLKEYNSEGQVFNFPFYLALNLFIYLFILFLFIDLFKKKKKKKSPIN